MRRQRNIVRRAGVWYFIARLAGRRWKVSLRTAEYSIARDRAAQVREQIERKITEAASDTVAAFSERWVNEWVKQQRNAKGIALARQRLRDHILPHVGKVRIGVMTQTDVRLLRAQIEGRLSPQSVRHVLADLKCLLRYAVECGRMPRVKWSRDLMPKAPEAAPRPIDDEQIEAILQKASPKDAWTIRFLLATGLRWGELRNLQWWHVSKDFLTIEKSKSGKLRRIPLVGITRELLEARRKEAKSVFVSPYRSVNAGFLVRRLWHAGRWHVHQLRHTFGCRWLEAGGSLSALQLVMGHSTPRMTERYARLSDKAVAAEAARIFKLDPFIGTMKREG